MLVKKQTKRKLKRQLMWNRFFPLWVQLWAQELVTLTEQEFWPSQMPGCPEGPC